MSTYSLRPMIAVIVLSSGLSVQAQDLSALTTRLKNLRSKDALRVEVLVEAGAGAGETGEPPESEKLHLILASDPNGLRLTVPGEVADTRLYREFSLFRASEIMHCAPSLVRELAGMELVESGPDSRDGVPCTRWHLQADEKLSQSGVTAKVHKDVAIWIDADGYPLAVSFKKQAESRMLFFKMTRESAREQAYRRCGDRLVLVWDRTTEADGDGKSRGAKRTVTTTTRIAAPSSSSSPGRG
jgi:hypothetical protein